MLFGPQEFEDCSDMALQVYSKEEQLSGVEPAALRVSGKFVFVYHCQS